MQKTVEYINNKVSPATVQLLIRERSKGKSLRQLGRMFNRSGERIRQVLAKYDLPQVTLLPETTAAAKLGYPLAWLIQLRKEGIINPIKPSGFWLYSEEQVKQIPSLIAEARKCEQCGGLRSPGSRRFCRECGQYRRKHYYSILSPEAKERHIQRCAAWRKANPEKYEATQSRSGRKYRAKQIATHTGKHLTAETRAKISAATKRRHNKNAVIDVK
ncbi:hypothetical protein ES703_07809 [subsurface metagenome]